MIIAGIAIPATSPIPIGAPTKVPSCHNNFFFLDQGFFPQNVHPEGLKYYTYIVIFHYFKIYNLTPYNTSNNANLLFLSCTTNKIQPHKLHTSYGCMIHHPFLLLILYILGTVLYHLL